MEIVHIEPGEECRLRDLRMRAVTDAPEAFGTTRSVMLRWSNEQWMQQLRDLPTFVVVEDGTDLGMVRGALDPRYPLKRHLISMWIAPEARGRGFGTALTRHTIEWAKSSGGTSLILGVVENNWGGRALYERMGFHYTGNEHVLDAPRGHLRELEMSIDLSSAASTEQAGE